MAEDEKKKPEGQSQELLTPESVREITQQNAHLVDFDNLKVRLICLISIPNAFAQVSTYLTRRGWEIFVTTEIKEALTQVSTFRPDFVLTSVNHPHKKINQVPQIVSKTFNVPVIAFGEKTDSKTMGAIQVSRAEYKIMGHLSGPTAQRKIKQILQDKYQVEEESKEGQRAFENIGMEPEDQQGPERTKSGQGAIKFSGRKLQKGTIVFEKSQANVKLSKTNAYNPIAQGKSQEPGASNKTGAAYNPKKQQGPESKTKAPLTAAEQIQKDKEEMAAALRELGSDIASGDLNKNDITEDKEASASFGSLHHEAKNQKDYGSVQVTKDKTKLKDQSYEPGKDSGPGEQKSALQKGQAGEDHYYNGQDSKPGQPDSIMEKGPAAVGSNDKTDSEGPQSKVLISAADRNHRKDEKKRSFIEKATIKVVQTMRDEEHNNDPGLRMVRRVALLSVGHAQYKGYFMIAGHDVDMSLDDFVQEFTELLGQTCMDYGEPMEFGDYINMECPDYDFFDNGEEGLEFNYVTSFGAGEIGVKFIHDEEAWAYVETPENHQKALIKAEQIVEDKPLAIDLYVHLQRNEKYFKIVNKESELSQSRKDRLMEKETDVFINNEDVSTYRTFQTRQKAERAINKTVQRTTKKKAS